MTAFDGSGMGVSRVESSIFGESALIDRETGRVYWECGNSNTLYESLTPRLDQFGVEHAQATFLTILITIAFLSVLSGWMRKAIDCCYDPTTLAVSSSWSARALSILVVLAECTILKLPKIENRWWVTTFCVLYFFESYHCTTRAFLANVVSNTKELETYLEELKQEPMVVTWNCQTFHFELRRLFALPRRIRSALKSLKNSKAEQTLSSMPLGTSVDPTASTTASTTQPFTKTYGYLPPPLPKSSRHTKPMFPFTRKVVTNEASATYRYGSCCDKTIVGVWNRAPSEGGAPFQKISLSKVLVLSDRRSREDYFRQQSEFVTQYGREDEFAEFSSSIEVANYRPRLLVVADAAPNESSDVSKRLVGLPFFWIFTCLGLTVPYRIWFKRQCDFWRVTVVKETKAMSGGGPAAYESYWRNWFSPQASQKMKREYTIKHP